MSPLRLLCGLLQMQILISARATNQDGELTSGQSEQVRGSIARKSLSMLKSLLSEETDSPHLCTKSDFDDVSCGGEITCEMDNGASCEYGLLYFSLSYSISDLFLTFCYAEGLVGVSNFVCSWIRLCDTDVQLQGQLPFKKAMDEDPSVHELNVQLLAAPAVHAVASNVEDMIWSMLPWLCFGVVLFSVVFSLCYCRKGVEKGTYQKIADGETNVLLASRGSV